MSALDAARDRWLAAWSERRDGFASDVPWLARLREGARDAFAENSLPHRKLEEWRYTSVLPLAKVAFGTPPTAHDVTRDDVERLSIPVFACSLFVFVDGCYAPGLSTPPALTGEVHVDSLARLRAEEPGRLEPHLGSLASVKEHPFAALNTAFLDDGAALFVPDGAQVESPMHVVFLTTQNDAPVVQHPRVLVVAGEGSRAVVIQDHVELGASDVFTNAVTEVSVGRNATLDLVLLQRESDRHFHVSNLQVRQERDSRFASHTVTLGGALVRNDLGVQLAGVGAECRMRGLFVADGDQLIDNHTCIDHAVPHGTSHETYKGVLGGRARGVFRGRVHVRPHAQKTHASQSSLNLLLSEGAEINTKPQLEIHADDVKCSHGSTIGQLDEDALFYLRTRGIEEQAARDLLAKGFVSEISAAIPIEPLRAEVDLLVAEKLARQIGDAR